VTEQQIAEPAFTAFLRGFRPYFATDCGFAHLATKRSRLGPTLDSG